MSNPFAPGPSELRRTCARLLTVGFSGQHLCDDLKELLDAGVGGVILFRRNIASRHQAAELIGRLKEYAPATYVGVDQEGGVVQRFREGFTRFPTLRSLGMIGDADLAYRFGQALGSELHAIGVDVNYAPVLDVDTNPNNPVIGHRSLGSDPALVAELGVALGRGLEAAGIASCGKHFPGHGDTAQDSHLSLPRLPHPRSRLDRVELVPFAAWAQAGLAAVMTAHVVFEAIDPTLPATLCLPVITGVLRDQLGFSGVVFSDDLEMRAIADHFGITTAGELSLRAGVDNVLCCHKKELALRLIEHFSDLASRDEGFAARVEESATRLGRFTQRFAQAAPVLEVLADGPEVVEEVLERAGAIAFEQGDDPTEILERLAPGCAPRRPSC